MNKIADFIIRYRNSNKKELELKTTKIGLSLLDVLEKTGYIKYSLVSKTQKKMIIELKDSRIRGLELISKNSRDTFLTHSDLLSDPKLKSTTSFYIMSTSKLGIISSWEALTNGIGGKILVRVW